MSDDKDTNPVLHQLYLTVSALQTACTFDFRLQPPLGSLSLSSDTYWCVRYIAPTTFLQKSNILLACVAGHKMNRKPSSLSCSEAPLSSTRHQKELMWTARILPSAKHCNTSVIQFKCHDNHEQNKVAMFISAVMYEH